MAMTAARHLAPSLSPGELRAWHALLRAHALVRALDAELEAAHGLPLSSYAVLGELADAPGERMRMCDLATTAFLSRSGLTRLVDRLEREGLLERVACATDARGAFARLTPAGHDRLRAARATHASVVHERFGGRFDERELALLADLLGRVRAPDPRCC